ncbi:hypothetical protein MRX96_022711 [Rhipicephalus microplus]
MERRNFIYYRRTVAAPSTQMRPKPGVEEGEEIVARGRRLLRARRRKSLASRATGATTRAESKATLGRDHSSLAPTLVQELITAIYLRLSTGLNNYPAKADLPAEDHQRPWEGAE